MSCGFGDTFNLSHRSIEAFNFGYTQLRQSEKQKRECLMEATTEHFREATCLQHLTFSWATKLILRAFSNEIDANELWDLPPDFSAEIATERLREKCKLMQLS